MLVTAKQPIVARGGQDMGEVQRTELETARANFLTLLESTNQPGGQTKRDIETMRNAINQYAEALDKEKSNIVNRLHEAVKPRTWLETIFGVSNNPKKHWSELILPREIRDQLKQFAYINIFHDILRFRNGTLGIQNPLPGILVPGKAGIIQLDNQETPIKLTFTIGDAEDRKTAYINVEWEKGFGWVVLYPDGERRNEEGVTLASRLRQENGDGLGLIGIESGSANGYGGGERRQDLLVMENALELIFPGKGKQFWVDEQRLFGRDDSGNLKNPSLANMDWLAGVSLRLYRCVSEIDDADVHYVVALSDKSNSGITVSVESHNSLLSIPF